MKEIASDNAVSAIQAGLTIRRIPKPYPQPKTNQGNCRHARNATQPNQSLQNASVKTHSARVPHDCRNQPVRLKPRAIAKCRNGSQVNSSTMPLRESSSPTETRVVAKCVNGNQLDPFTVASQQGFHFSNAGAP